MEGQDGGGQPDADPARARGGGGGEARRVHREAVVDEVVLGQPDLVEAQLLRPLHLLELAVDDLGVGEAGRGLEEEEGPEAHGPEIIALLDTFAGPEQYAIRRISDGDTRRRDRRAHLPPLDLPARGGSEGLHLQPVPGRRGRAPALPLRPARPLPGRLAARRRASWTCAGCAGSPSATSSPTSAGPSAEWLDAAPAATVAHGAIGCAIWLNDQSPRPPRALANDEVLDLGGRRVRRLDTPHVPHCWDAGLLYEETTGTLFTSDLFTHVGDPAAVTGGDIMGPATAAEKQFGFTGVTPATGATIRRLAGLAPRTLAVMHGSSFSGAARAGARVAGRLLRRAAAEGRGAPAAASLPPARPRPLDRCAGSRWPSCSSWPPGWWRPGSCTAPARRCGWPPAW